MEGVSGKPGSYSETLPWEVGEINKNKKELIKSRRELKMNQEQKKEFMWVSQAPTESEPLVLCGAARM